MGFFSFKTTDTNRSINNAHSGIPTFKVVVVDDNGNEYVEHNYNGYGIFGGIDIFILIAEMNGYLFNDDNDPDQEYETLRNLGIQLYYEEPEAIHPNIYEVPQEWANVPLDSCEAQGFFY
jgi:hypothetical protein